MQKYISRSEDETKQIAKALTKIVRQVLRPRTQDRLAHHKSNVFALTGELGSGKTTFVQGFTKGLGIQDKIISPTFVLIRQHKIPDTSKVLYHIDLYRLENLQDIRCLGLEEIWSDPNNIVLIEWAEKAKNFLPKNTIWIYFETINGSQRKISVK